MGLRAKSLIMNKTLCVETALSAVAYPGIFFGVGFQQIQLRTEDRTGIWGAVVPYSGVLEASVIWYKNFHFIYKMTLIFGTLDYL